MGHWLWKLRWELGGRLMVLAVRTIPASRQREALERALGKWGRNTLADMGHTLAPPAPPPVD
jgi:hypothetical protein